ncbi:MAG: hypothetical protein NTZ46_05670 [Verrucomicrobia bacterium]|nr:hypothetical protein [Verrucomicrobiota bacterium]
MKKTISTLALVLAASAFTAIAQDAPTPKHEGRPRMGGKDGPMHQALESLTPQERQQLMAARQKAEADPAVATAKQNAEVAMKAMREAMKAAMLKADPTIGPVLEKMEAARKNAKPEGKPHHPGKGEPEAEAN